jgi:hypothetical protein
MTMLKRSLVGVLAVALLTVPLNAALRASATRPGNWTFPQGAVAAVPLTTSGSTALTFSGSGKHVITYSAECAVGAPAGNASTWVTIDIYLDGVALPPTAGTLDAFCVANGTASLDGWATHAISVPTPALPTGTHTVEIKASVQSGAAGDVGWLSDSSLVVTK